MTTKTTTCPRCKGSGKTSLAWQLSQTLAKFTRRSRLTVRDCDTPGVSVPTMMNRLESLRRKGLLERAYEGTSYRYFLPAKEAK